MLRILGGARPVPNATADSSKAYTYLRSFPRALREVFRKSGLWASRPGIETRSLTISARQEPSDEFFCSFLDHPGSHLDQVYDSPPAYFWCANPGVVEGTLAVMVGASCGAMPGRAARCLSSVHGQFCSIRPTWRWLQGILYSCGIGFVIVVLRERLRPGVWHQLGGIHRSARSRG